jgi:hypothetical protein
MHPRHAQTQREQFYRTYRDIVQEIMGKENAFFFFKPVDPEADGAPDYFRFINHPMSIFTVQEKLDRGEYNTPGEFISDMRLIWSNAKNYNHASHPIYKTADMLAELFEILASSLPHALSSAERGSALQRLTELRFARYRAAKQTHK